MYHVHVSIQYVCLTSVQLKENIKRILERQCIFCCQDASSNRLGRNEV